MKLVLFSLLFAYHAFGGSTLTGKIKSKDGCTQGSQLFVSTPEKDLLYQVEVPINGSFSFNLKEGKYILNAANEEGCNSGAIKVEIPKQKSVNINLKREAKGKK